VLGSAAWPVLALVDVPPARLASPQRPGALPGALPDAL